MKIQTKKWIRLSVILYIAILAAVTVFTLAWFMFDETAIIATQDNMQITAGSKLEIAVVDANGKINEEKGYGQLITMATNATMPDITGDGYEFYVPTVLDANDETYESFDYFHPISNEEKDLYYITVHLRVKTTLPVDVYLAEGSYVKGASDVLMGEDAENKSSFGDFSRDCIAGAARVAFLEYNPADDTYIRKNIWIPNDNYRLMHDPENDLAATFDMGGREYYTADAETGEKRFDYGYLMPNGDGSDKIMERAYLREASFAKREATLGEQSLATSGNDKVPMINNSAPLLEFDTEDVKEDIKTYGSCTKDLIIRIWIEGTDREASRAFTDGKMKYNFVLTGIDKKDFDKENPDVKVANIVSDGSKLYTKNGDSLTEIESNVMQYSYNGADWNSYSGILAHNLPWTPMSVYVRFAETAHVKASEPAQVTFSGS